MDAHTSDGEDAGLAAVFTLPTQRGVTLPAYPGIGLAATAGRQVRAELAALARRIDAGRRRNIGFPGATDVDYRPLAALLVRPLNNIGDPYTAGVGTAHTRELEREVVEWVAGLLRAPAGDRWGYVTTGGHEGTLYALRLARSLHPSAVVYFSDAAHYSVDKAVDLLGMEAVRIRTGRWGEMDYTDLAMQVQQRRHRPAVVVATAGTTMTEAVDDVTRIVATLDDLAVRRRFIAVDAALSGIGLALTDPTARRGFDFDDGADAVSISGHKFLGCPAACGVVVVRQSHRARVAREVAYIGAADATITGSRSGHTVLMWWYAIRTLGVEGMRARADRSRQLAAYLHGCLGELGWVSHHHPLAMTVVLRTPPASVLRRWVLASQDGWSHVITAPGVQRDTIDAFLAELADAIGRTDPPGHPGTSAGRDEQSDEPSSDDHDGEPDHDDQEHDDQEHDDEDRDGHDGDGLEDDGIGRGDEELRAAVRAWTGTLVPAAVRRPGSGLGQPVAAAR